MSDLEDLDHEANRLLLTRIVGWPDAWRGRAAAASGLVSAAAAAILVALLLRDDLRSSPGHDAAIWAAAFYVFAVVLYLIASVLPASAASWFHKAIDEKKLPDAQRVRNKSEREARAIRLTVHAGTCFAVLAVGLTAYAAIRLVQAEPGVTGSVILTEASLDVVQEICPTFSDDTIVQVQRSASATRVEFTCDDQRVEIELGADAVLAVVLAGG